MTIARTVVQKWMVICVKLIDLDDLMQFPIRWNHYDEEHGSIDFISGVEVVLDYAQSLSTIDAEPVMHGCWVEIEESTDGHLKECSVCKNWIFHNFNYVSKYCPDCGAKMDLED